MENAKVAGNLPGILVAYGANTHNGIIRNYNEDRISIVLELQNPRLTKMHKSDRRISYFAIFDGHGGQGCSDFLRDNLH